MSLKDKIGRDWAPRGLYAKLVSIVLWMENDDNIQGGY